MLPNLDGFKLPFSRFRNQSSSAKPCANQMSAKTELRGGSFLVSLMCAASSKYTDDPPFVTAKSARNAWCITTGWTPQPIGMCEHKYTDAIEVSWTILSCIVFVARNCLPWSPTSQTEICHSTNPLQSIAQRHTIVTPKQIEKWNLTSSSDDLRFHCFGWFLYIDI